MSNSRNPFLVIAFVCAVGLLMGADSEVEANERYTVGVNVQSGNRPQPVIVERHHQVQSAGYYEDRYERVLVQQAHYHKQYVPPVVETRYLSCGRSYTVVVRDGYCQEVYVPAQYETRVVRVWVPARTVVYNAPVSDGYCTTGRPSYGYYHRSDSRYSSNNIGFGLNVRF